jgi:hypothetical protein
MMRFHPSSLASIMGDAKSIDPMLLDTDDLRTLYRKKSKTPEDQAILEPLWDRTLSAGAKTYLKAYASEFLFGYHATFSSRETDKGAKCEQNSIDLLNAVLFERFTKNTERKMTELLSGECDIYKPAEFTLDVKSCWSITSFPLLSEDCHSTVYEWQGRGYMHLWDVPKHKVAFCMVDTPDDLIPNWEPEELHKVSHHAPHARVSMIEYTRDMVLEQKMLTRCAVAQEYLKKVVAQFNAEHNIVPDWKKQILQQQ